jgi:hypothetical protein
VEVALDVEVDDFGAVVGAGAAALDVFAGVVVAIEVVVLVLPHPAISAAQSNVTASFENRPAVTFPPLIYRAPDRDRQRPLGGRTQLAQGYP